MKICSVEGCEESGKLRRGWCNKHYLRWYRNGDPQSVIQPNYDTPEEAFAARTEWQGDCLVWVGSHNGLGYGEIVIKGKKKYVHRYAWEQVYGEIPVGMKIDHKEHCVPACCNPKHLRLATQQQNTWNRGNTSTAVSGHRNVYRDKNKWIVRLKRDDKYYFFGRFELDQLEEAVTTAEQARASMFGEFAGKG